MLFSRFGRGRGAGGGRGGGAGGFVGHASRGVRSRLSDHLIATWVFLPRLLRSTCYSPPHVGHVNISHLSRFAKNRGDVSHSISKN